MKCSKCGFVLPDDSEFCQYCGVKLNQEVTSADSIEDAVATPVPENLIEQPEPLAVSADTIAEPVVVEGVHEPIAASEELAATGVVADTHLPSDSEADGRAEPSITSAPLISQEPPDAMTPSKKANKRKIKQRYCKFCGHKIDYITKKCTGCGKQYLRWKIRLSTVLLVLALIASITVNSLQYLSILDLKEDGQFLSSLETALLQLRSSNIGSSSNTFKIEKGVVVLQANGPKKEMSLSAGIERNKRLILHVSDHSVATVTISKKTSLVSTVTITPKKKGATVATFSNTYDHNTFKVLIIVTD